MQVFFSILIRSAIKGIKLKTTSSNFIRDYINTDDIIRIIDLILCKPKNDAVDIFLNRTQLQSLKC